MKLALVELALLGFLVVMVLALVFRSQRAAEALRFLRKVVWVYIAVIIALALWQLAREGI